LAAVRLLGSVRGWVWSGGSNLNLAPGPLGSVAGDGDPGSCLPSDPDRHRGSWLLCPSSVPAVGGG
jgi:hypothetical protein